MTFSWNALPQHIVSTRPTGPCAYKAQWFGTWHVFWHVAGAKLSVDCSRFTSFRASADAGSSSERLVSLKASLHNRGNCMQLHQPVCNIIQVDVTTFLSNQSVCNYLHITLELITCMLHQNQMHVVSCVSLVIMRKHSFIITMLLSMYFNVITQTTLASIYLQVITVHQCWPPWHQCWCNYCPPVLIDWIDCVADCESAQAAVKEVSYSQILLFFIILVGREILKGLHI
jgi:hypothetical protein